MKKLFITSLSLAALINVALAADLPSRKGPVEVAPTPIWQGFYAGLNAGYSWGANSSAYSQNWGYDLPFNAGLVDYAGVYSFAPISMSGSISNPQSGFMGGAQFGYNYQLGVNILLGVETDIQGANVRGVGRSFGYSAGNVASTDGQASGPDTSFGATKAQAGLDYLGTLRGRIGYVWSTNVLLYGTGGFAYGGAWANVDQTSSESLQQFYQGQDLGVGTQLWIGSGQQKQLLTGWTVGAGSEWMFMPNWSLKAEALYWNLGRMNINTVSYGSSGSSIGWGRTNVDYSGIVARAGLNYHFNLSGAPIAAKF